MKNMKKMLAMALVAVAVLCSCAPKDKNTLRVVMDVPGFGDTVMINGGPEELMFLGKDGKFAFEIQVDTPYMAVLYQPKMERGERENALSYRVPFVGGDKMRLWQTDPSRYDVDGTGFYAEYHQIDLFVEEALKPVYEASKKYHEMDEDENISEEENSAFFKETVVAANRKFWHALVDYAKAHPKQEAVVPILDDHMGDGELHKIAFESLDASVREGRMRVFYDRWLRECEECARKIEKDAEAAKKHAAGLVAPTFTLNDINGKPLSLESFRGKYVILDFWGSWCGWCIKGFPKMKEYYAKYKGKLEILGIDCRDTEADWKAAVEKHQVPWLNVYCPGSATVEADYGVSSYPTKIIIGPDGKIVQTIVGEDSAFYTLLDDLFGK